MLNTTGTTFLPTSCNLHVLLHGNVFRVSAVAESAQVSEIKLHLLLLLAHHLTVLDSASVIHVQRTSKACFTLHRR